MKPSDFQKTVQCRFESCLKKVVRHVVKDYQKKLKRRQKEETLFCELPEIVVENLAVWDDYDTDYTIFNVCGNDIRICDDELAEALKHLSERNRENLLMYYFLEMSDTEIAKRQNISRSGVFQNRHNSLELMKKILKEKIKYEKQRYSVSGRSSSDFRNLCDVAATVIFFRICGAKTSLLS